MQMEELPAKAFSLAVNADLLLVLVGAFSAVMLIIATGHLILEMAKLTVLINDGAANATQLERPVEHHSAVI